MSREKCPTCGAFIATCAKCEKRPSLAVAVSPADGKQVYIVTIAGLVAWSQRCETRGWLPDVERLIADLKDGRV